MAQSEDCAAICVQKFDDSLSPAIHTTYRDSLRSSSLWKPRDPSSRGLFVFYDTDYRYRTTSVVNGVFIKCAAAHIGISDSYAVE